METTAGHWRTFGQEETNMGSTGVCKVAPEMVLRGTTKKSQVLLVFTGFVDPQPKKIHPMKGK